MLSQFIPSLKNKKQRQQRLKELEDSAKLIRAEIDKKLAEVKAVDKQLADVLTDTQHLTHSIQQKLNMRLKITRNSLKTIMHSLRDGIVILDYSGNVVEMNLASFKITDKDHFIGKSFNELAQELEITLPGDVPFQVDPKFFEEFSTYIFEKTCPSLSCDEDCANCVYPLSELEAYLKAKIRLPNSTKIKIRHDSTTNCNVNFKIFDNSPEDIRDVSYVLFFKRMQRIGDSTQRQRAVTSS
jgi:hypothetical protein